MRTIEVKIYNYGDYSNDNYGSSRAVKIGKLTLYFSYQTVVAFAERGGEFCISENVWSRTTGRHLNNINSNHEKRIPHKKFVKKLDKLLQKYELKEVKY